MTNINLQTLSSGDVLGLVEYEIHMLRFCLHKLDGTSSDIEKDAERMYLEGFLLHYRNLIRFFSGRGRADEISMRNLERFCPGVLKDQVGWYEQQVASLDNDNKVDLCEYKLISKLLQHCTEDRVTLLGRTWPVSEMYEKLKPVLDEFEKECLKRTPEQIVLPGPVSYDTVTRTPSVTIRLNWKYGNK